MRALVVAIVLMMGSETVASTQRVLVLHSFGRDVEAHASFSRVFRSDLAATSDEPIEFYELSLATVLLDGGEAEPGFVNYLIELERRSGFDLVVSVGGPAARFVQRHRTELFATTPLLIGAADVRHLREQEITGLDAVVVVRVDLRGVVENILRVLPETKEILVVLGTTPLEQFWVKELRTDTQPFLGRIRFTYLDSLPFTRILERAAEAPAGTAILYAMMLRDAGGIPYGEEGGLADLRAVSHAPIFGLYEYQLGKGIVGGPLIPLESLARRASRIAGSVLAGEAPSKLRPPPPAPVLAFDEGELSRWNIPRSRLLPGSDVRFVRPTFWRVYRWRILAVAAFCVGQGLLIVWLFASRARVRLAESEIRDVSGRLVAAQEDERARLARELHDDVTQRLARLAIDAGRVEMSGAYADGPEAGTIRDLRAGLVRLSEDVHVLSYNLHPSLLDDLGLLDAIRAECDRVSGPCALAVEVAAEDLPISPPRGTARCLFRVAQESLRNVVRHARATSVTVRLTGERRGMRLTVHDDGIGFDASTQRRRPTLGLVSMRERVRMAGGTFTLDSVPGRGTTVSAWVPLEEPPAS